MVFGKVYIVRGIVIDSKEALELNKHFNDIVFEDQGVYIKNIIIKNNTKIYYANHQHKGEKLFIIGKKLHTYYRKFVKCTHTDCQNCFGQTDGGFYNPYELVKEPKEINDLLVCDKCGHRNSVTGIPCQLCNYDYNGSHQVDNALANMILQDLNKFNKVEESKDNIALKRRWIDTSIMDIVKKIRNIDYIFGETTECKTYAIIDDCLCCS